MERKSNVPMYVGALLGLAVYAGGTYVVTQQAGGTEISPAESNTPNAVTPGAPGVVPTPNPWMRTVAPETEAP